MDHPPILQLSMYADEALADPQKEQITAHVAGCDHCRQQLRALEQSSRQVAAALQLDVDVPQAPGFTPPASLRGFAMANVATGLVIWLAQFLWKTLFGEAVLNAASWFTSIFLPDIYAMASGAALYLIEEGTAMLDAYLGFIVVSVVMFSALALLLMRYRARAGTGFCVVAALLVVTALPSPAHALEIRRDEGVVTIPASETIDDTLLVAGETVLIEGVVTGDVVAVGASVDISGDVGGNVIAFAETVRVRGKVGGTVIGASRTFDLDGAAVGGDLWLAGESLSVDGVASVARNATLAGQSLTLEGSVGRDFYAFGESIEISGELDGNLEAFANRVRLVGDARIGGNVRFRSDSEDRLYRADSVTINGDVEFLGVPDEMKPSNPYSTVEFYLWQVARLIAAFLVGWLLLTYVSSLRKLTLASGVEGLKSAGIGFLTVIGVPVAALLVAITIVGLPFAMIAIMVWLLALYLTQIVVGNAIGRMLLGTTQSVPQPLLVGLLVVFVVINLPWVGGIFDFVFTIIGLGLLVQYVTSLVAKQRGGQPAPDAG